MKSFSAKSVVHALNEIRGIDKKKLCPVYGLLGLFYSSMQDREVESFYYLQRFQELNKVTGSTKDCLLFSHSIELFNSLIKSFKLT